MGEFRSIAERLAEILSQPGDFGAVTPEHLPIIIGEACGGNPFNCFPGGEPNYGCCDLAVFVALKPYRGAKGRNHLGCNEALQLIVHHEADCPNTRNWVFITYAWDPVAADFWMANLAKIQRHAHLEIYLIAPGNVNEIVR